MLKEFADDGENAERDEEGEEDDGNIIMQFLGLIFLLDQEHVEHSGEDEGDGIGGDRTHNIKHILNVVHSDSDGHNECK